MVARALLAGLLLAGCTSIPPERIERDRVILAAIQPCKERYAERLYNTDMMSVLPDGTVRFFYKGDNVQAAGEIRQCLTDTTKGLRLGPWQAGRLVRAGPAEVEGNPAGKELLVPVRVNGVPGTMVARTGADFSFVTFAYAQRAGVRVMGESPTIRVRVGGLSVVKPYARANTIDVGDARVESMDVVVYEQVTDLPGADGVLGKPFFSHFKMNIDRANNRMTLEPIKRP
jgi:aspartyl protease